MRMLITEDNLLIAYNTHTSLINSVTVYTRHASVSNLKVVEGKAWQDTSSYCFSKTVHSPLFFCKIIEIERFVLQAAILHECQNYLWGGDGLGGSKKNRGTVITSLLLAFRRHDRNFTPFTIH